LTAATAIELYLAVWWFINAANGDIGVIRIFVHIATFVLLMWLWTAR